MNEELGVLLTDSQIREVRQSSFKAVHWVFLVNGGGGGGKFDGGRSSKRQRMVERQLAVDKRLRHRRRQVQRA
ncbi:hypothetical protein Q1695_001524 [Nippostrongylus brasiliensis]|nr:hypothetical protein Q1695_001524 [Nippostrongylus brasiliensis]